MNKNDWQSKIVKYCEDYNLPLYYLSDTLYDPKVIPMIRGKAFEYTVLERIKSILNSDIWEISKPFLNPQLGLHDTDVLVKHKPTNKLISIECKLASKGSCRVSKNRTLIKVKCMRSRTLGVEMVNHLSPKLKIDPNVLTIHNDQYLPSDFDFVITSIGNAFYSTNEKGVFYFNPQEEHFSFLKNFPGVNLKDETFNQLYFASAESISIKRKNKIKCTRKKCKNPNNCGFIPNYPV
ncbi:MAG: hypothetical protein KDK90_26300, partial [Leptospiraceae bacterium]|nr:hypothetical protein [Leptospiraceae bacterium]